MKRLLCLLFASLMLCGCAASPTPLPAASDPSPAPNAEPETPSNPPAALPVVNGYADFCGILSAALIDGTKNRNLSPVSVYLALAMVTEGAEGATKAELLALLGCASIEELRGVCGAMLESLSVEEEDSSLILADSLWVRENAPTREAFCKSLSDLYRSEVNTVRFGTKETAAQIADWIRVQTHEKITLSPEATDFDPNTVAVLINTIYLKDAWRDEFYEGATQPGPFYGPTESTVSYMHRYDDDTYIVRGEGFLRYSLPLLRVGRMTFVLPDEETPLATLLGTPEQLHTLLYSGESINAHVDVRIPKFRFEDQLDLGDTLEALGLRTAFDPMQSDFTGISEAGAVLSKVLQGSYIGVDEKGVEAAAFTLIASVEGMAMPAELPEIDFHLTRPFLFCIESYDGTVLFLGTVTAPTAAN